MEEEWLTDFLQEQGAIGSDPGAKKSNTQYASHLRKPKGKRDDSKQSDYITPPNPRNDDAAEAATNLRVPVMAVKVLPEESAQSRSAETLSLSQPSREPEWDSTTSCVPPGAAWVTMVNPPRREKRSRKTKALPSASSDGYASSGEGPSKCLRGSSTDSISSSALSRSSSRRTMHELDDRSDSFELMPVPTEFADMAITRKQMEATTSFDETTSESNEGLNEDDEYELNDPNLNESSRRKVRHNLTERRRVDRMNQLFKKLFEALEDSDPAGLTSTPNKYAELLNVCGADGKPINPNKWSKADVLEGALNVIQDLRKHLVEERLARTLGVPVSEEYTLDDESMTLQNVNTLRTLDAPTRAF